MAEEKNRNEIKNFISLLLILLFFTPPAIFIYYFIYSMNNVLYFPPKWVYSLFWVSFITVPTGISLIAISLERISTTGVRKNAQNKFKSEYLKEKEVFNSSQPDKEVPQTDRLYMVPPTDFYGKRNNANPTPASKLKGKIYVVDGEIEELDKKWREDYKKRLVNEREKD